MISLNHSCWWNRNNVYFHIFFSFQQRFVMFYGGIVCDRMAAYILSSQMFMMNISHSLGRVQIEP